MDDIQADRKSLRDDQVLMFQKWNLGVIPIFSLGGLKLFPGVRGKEHV